VLRLKVKGERELITLIGHAPIVSPGEYASASGNWVTDREHGRQFRAVFVKISPGEVRARKITSGWADQKVIRSIMVFLHAHGVSTSRAVRIFKT
jgi:exodeoxyribonuclease V alpha subunit